MNIDEDMLNSSITGEGGTARKVYAGSKIHKWPGTIRIPVKFPSSRRIKTSSSPRMFSSKPLFSYLSQKDPQNNSSINKSNISINWKLASKRAKSPNFYLKPHNNASTQDWDASSNFQTAEKINSSIQVDLKHKMERRIPVRDKNKKNSFFEKDQYSSKEVLNQFRKTHQQTLPDKIIKKPNKPGFFQNLNQQVLKEAKEVEKIMDSSHDQMEAAASNSNLRPSETPQFYKSGSMQPKSSNYSYKPKFSLNLQKTDDQPQNNNFSLQTQNQLSLKTVLNLKEVMSLDYDTYRQLTSPPRLSPLCSILKKPSMDSAHSSQLRDLSPSSVNSRPRKVYFAKNMVEITFNQ